MKPPQIKIKKNKSGIYYARVNLGTSKASGKRMRPQKSFPEAKTEDEALALAEKWVSVIAPNRRSSDFLTLDDVIPFYIEDKALKGASPTSVLAYETINRAYIAPYIGNQNPREIQPYEIEHLYAMLATHGGKHSTGIDSNTIIKVHWFLCGLWKWMCRMEICTINPMVAVEKPKKTKREATAFNEEEFAIINNALESILHSPAKSQRAIFKRNCAMAAFMSLWCGHRCGEACGTLVEDVQLVRNIIHIGGTAIVGKNGLERKETTKGKKPRNVALSKPIAKELKAHLAWQSERLGTKYIAGRNALLITVDGSLINPNRISTEFASLRDELNLPKNTSFHTLRHTHATWLLMSGVDIKTISERMGHASEATTLTIYSHLLPGRDAQAASIFEETAAKIGGHYA
jgi:integrase